MAASVSARDRKIKKCLSTQTITDLTQKCNRKMQ